MKARFVRLASGDRVIVPTENVEKHLREIGGPLRPPVKSSEKKNPELSVTITVVENAPAPQHQGVFARSEMLWLRFGGTLFSSFALDVTGSMSSLDPIKLTRKERRRIDREFSYVPVDERPGCRQVSSKANALEYYGNKEYGRSRDKRGDYRSNDFWSKQAHLCRTRAHNEKRDQRAVRMPLIDLLSSDEMPVKYLTVRTLYSGRKKYGYYGPSPFDKK